MAVIDDTRTDIEKYIQDIYDHEQQTEDAFEAGITIGGKMIWKNPRFSPEQIVAAMPPEQFTKLVRASLASQAFFAQITGRTVAIVPDEFDLALNTDGTFTVVRKPVPSPIAGEPIDMPTPP